jgi:ubiquinone/menaquinone biosynthesis C-methylase UbiE
VQYGELAAVYDVLMMVVPHRTWLSRIEKSVRLRGRSPKSALDIACGTGIVTETLFRRGYKPTAGFDLSESMIQIARTKAQAKNLEIDYHIADAATLNLPEQRFDLLVSMFDSINYILEPEAVQQAFHRFYAHASPRAILAFDMNTPYALSAGMFTQQDLEAVVRHNWISHYDEVARLCRVEMDFWVTDPHTNEERTFHETHWQRAYSIKDIKTWLTKAGWTKIEVFGNYSDRPPGPRTDRWLFVCERD